jgi:hypothetical protein
MKRLLVGSGIDGIMKQELVLKEGYDSMNQI